MIPGSYLRTSRVFPCLFPLGLYSYQSPSGDKSPKYPRDPCPILPRNSIFSPETPIPCPRTTEISWNVPGPPPGLQKTKFTGSGTTPVCYKKTICYPLPQKTISSWCPVAFHTNSPKQVCLGIRHQPPLTPEQLFPGVCIPSCTPENLLGGDLGPVPSKTVFWGF